MMKVSILISVSMDELLEYQKSYAELNGEWLPPEVAKQEYIDRFMADRADYIDTDNIQVQFV